MIFRTAKLLVGLCCLLALVGLVLGCVGCPSSEPAEQTGAAPPAGMSLEKAGPEALAPGGAGGSGGSSTAPAENQLDIYKVRAQQMIIWTATYSVRTDKAADAANQFRKLVDATGGFISAQDKTVDDSGVTEVKMTARVPSAKFWDTISGLESLGRVEQGKTDSQNVTEEWVDLGARLEIRELRKAQLEALLKKAQSLDEIDQRQQEILAVQEEIERIQGRQHVIQNQVALSTIDVTFFEKGLAPVMKPGPFSVRSTALRSWYYLLAVLKVLFVVLMFVVLPGAVIWVPLLLWHLLRKKRPLPRA